MSDRETNATTIAALAARAPGADADCIDLEAALRLCAEFSAASGEADLSATLGVPVPGPAYCEFTVRPWGEIDDRERESFRRFYTRVGGELEAIAEGARRGVELDEAAWREITAGVRSRR